MIISIDRKPIYSLYYIGGVIINILQLEGSIPFDRLIEKIITRFEEEITIDYVYYGLDWLYLLCLIEIEKDRVILCK